MSIGEKKKKERIVTGRVRWILVNGRTENQPWLGQK